MDELISHHLLVEARLSATLKIVVKSNIGLQPMRGAAK